MLFQCTVEDPQANLYVFDCFPIQTYTLYVDEDDASWAHSQRTRIVSHPCYLMDVFLDVITAMLQKCSNLFLELCLIK